MQAREAKVIKLTLAAVWIITGVLSLGIYPVDASLALLARVGITGAFAVFTLYFEAVLDIVIGILTVAVPSKKLWLLQAAIIIAYTLVISVYLPEYWLHPFGPILKNLPILTLLWLLYKHEGVTQ